MKYIHSLQCQNGKNSSNSSVYYPLSLTRIHHDFTGVSVESLISNSTLYIFPDSGLGRRDHRPDYTAMDVDEEGDSSKKENCRKIHLLELSDEILLVILQNLDSPSLFSLAK